MCWPQDKMVVIIVRDLLPNIGNISRSGPSLTFPRNNRTSFPVSREEATIEILRIKHLFSTDTKRFRWILILDLFWKILDDINVVYS